MQKTLKDLFEVYRPKSPDEQKFVDKHVTIKHKDRNGNGDDVFNASNVKTIKRKEDNHGYDSGDDEKVYEETDPYDVAGMLKKAKAKFASDHPAMKHVAAIEDIKKNGGALAVHGSHVRSLKKALDEEVEDLDESAKVAAHLIKRYGTNVRKSHVRSAANDFGVGFVALSHAVRKKLGVNRLDEDEQIDELSTSTLKNYRTKARADAYDADDVDDERRFRKRAAGSNTAGKKLVKRGESLKTEEVEEVDERFGDGDQRYDTRPEPKPAEKEPTSRLGQFLKKRKEKAAKANMDKLAADYAERQRTHRTHRESEEIDVESLDLLNSIEEKKLTPAEMKKREEVAKAIERENPKMPMSKKMAIATATAKKVAEEAESIDELSRGTVGRYSMKAKSIADNEGGKDRTKGRELAGRKRWGGSMAGVDKAKVMATEESDQIDELSKGTMGRYINKAKDSIDMASYRQGHKEAHGSSSKPLEKKLSKRHKGIETAVDKLTKEGVEQVDEISTKLALDYTDKASDARGHKNLSTPKLDKRYKSMALAHEKIRARHAKVATTEEVEGLEELSKKTMGSYVKKASGAERPKNPMNPKSVPMTTLAAYQGDSETGHFGKRFNQATYDKTERLRKNRETGIKRAVDKMTKEQVIDNAIEKFMPVLEDYKPMTQEEKLVAKLDGLSESHALTLLSLFEGLNEDNRTKMLGIVDTREGINSLLDFALQNRGE